MKIHWSEDPSKAPKSSFTKHLKNQAQINKRFILGTSKTSTSSTSHRFYNLFWTPSCGNHLTVSGDPKSASRPIRATSFERYKNNGLDSNSISSDASRGTNVSILPRTCAKSRLPRQEQIFWNSQKWHYFPDNFNTFEFSTSEMAIFPKEFQYFWVLDLRHVNISYGISILLSSRPQTYQYFLWNFNTFEFSTSDMSIFPMEFQWFCFTGSAQPSPAQPAQPASQCNRWIK